MSNLIEIHELRKAFRRNVGEHGVWRRLLSHSRTEELVALESLSLGIADGEFFSLLGPNGTGKTTVVKILCTLLLPDSGFCRVAGFDVVKQSREVRRQIGVSIRDERSVYWRLTGRQNLQYFAVLTVGSTSVR